ncbi:acetate--CoA ligase [Allobranchiibius sp. CTAmp26]|uniref:acetate--CoA ligase n=1 Tax=Allobranchiibius sp. CTAmp26 TaxID=2815214 RepID=UPI001AA10264|nr:acetate--CoA ligase [Allobranchiibius sp. CTAmp26]MBO1756094.1 acetate--CoA ligase [Allobranchiibius sp. CTAmp26]
MSSGAYEAAYEASMRDPEAFWADAARGIDWINFPKTVLDDSHAPLYRWFPDGRMNTCFNALDRHVIAGRADQPAVIWDSPVTQDSRTYTYAQLLDLVGRAAGMLTALGVQKGDRVVIYLPMIPEAVVSMLACARIGAVHAVVFGGFAPAELAARIDDARPKVLITASCGVERTRVVEYKPMVDAAIERAQHPPESVVVLQRPQAEAPMGERDIDWRTAMRPDGVGAAGCVPMLGSDPLYILHTSGTTGRPKGIVRDTGGHAVALHWSMTHIFGMQPGDVWFTASDVGWVVGHSYIVYAPLLAGCTTVLLEGKPVGTPDASTFWRMIEQHRIAGLFTAPTGIRAIKKEDPEGALIAGRDLSSLRTLFLAGERTDPDTWQWATDRLQVPVIDNWWQTETGWPICANPIGTQLFPIKPGSATMPSPGYDVRVLDADGEPCAPGQEGALCIKLPMPPGTLATLWGDDDRYVESYLSAYDGYYLTGDGGYIDDDGYVWVMGRTDDVLNVAGHRLSTGGLEAVVASHPAVAECAVIGVADELKGQVPRALVVLKGADEPSEEEQERIRTELTQLVREQVGAIAGLQRVDIVAALPKTRSGKILRRTMRQLADGDDPQVPGTIEDTAVLDALAPVLRGP